MCISQKQGVRLLKGYLGKV